MGDRLGVFKINLHSFIIIFSSFLAVSVGRSFEMFIFLYTSVHKYVYDILDSYVHDMNNYILFLYVQRLIIFSYLSRYGLTFMASLCVLVL